MKDNIYAEHLAHITDFNFSLQVAKTFDDMASRSIPFYHEVQRQCAELIHYFYQEDGIIYDLGSSTGSLADQLIQQFGDNPFRYIGIDNSQPMIDEAANRFTKVRPAHSIQFLCTDLIDCSLNNAHVIVSNYTIQFIRPISRLPLLRRIYESLQPGGAFLLSEKVLESNSENSRLFHRLYYELKKRNGYTETEIAQKREALENVLIPYRLEENLELLKEAGFQHVDIFFKWYNFTSFIATKKG